MQEGVEYLAVTASPTIQLGFSAAGACALAVHGLRLPCSMLRVYLPEKLCKLRFCPSAFIPSFVSGDLDTTWRDRVLWTQGRDQHCLNPSYNAYATGQCYEMHASLLPAKAQGRPLALSPMPASSSSNMG
jgi:hypothetical protein